MYATLRHHLQPQKVAQIHSKTGKKQGRNAQPHIFIQKTD